MRHESIAFENRTAVVVDARTAIDFLEPIDPLELPGEAGEREAAINAITWLLRRIGERGIVAKVLALRFLLHMESGSMEQIASGYGLTRAAISRWLVTYADAFNMPTLKAPQARQAYSKRQLEVWSSRRAARKRVPKPAGAT